MFPNYCLIKVWTSFSFHLIGIVEHFRLSAEQGKDNYKKKYIPINENDKGAHISDDSVVLNKNNNCYGRPCGVNELSNKPQKCAWKKSTQTRGESGKEAE